MSFLIQFIPVSKISFLALGYIFISMIPQNLLNGLTLIIIHCSLCLGIFFNYKKLSALCLGILLGSIQFIYFCQEIPFSNLKEQDIISLKSKKEFKILFLKEIKRNYYKTEIIVGDEVFYSITKRAKKDSILPELLCDSTLISTKKIPSDKEYFRFLLPYHSIYTQVPEYKCKLLSETIDSKKEVRKKMEELLVRSGITDYANDIAMGLIFGDSSYLDTEFKEKVREGGILHLFAASGLHIGVFIGFIFFFAKRLWFLNYYTEKIFPLLIAFSYLYLLDFPISLLRAYIFACILVLGSLFFRKMKSIDLILVSASLILFIDPENFLTLSFTLSYSAVCGILFLKQFLDKLCFGNWKNFFTENFTISISASLGTYPVLLFYFKTFSFGSIFLNILLVPLTSLLLPLLYISLLLQSIYEFLFSGLLQALFWRVNHYFCEIGFLLNWCWNFSLVCTEIFWSYSELLLRVLAYLSESLSDTVGFYRSVRNSFFFHIVFYIGLLLLLTTCFLLLDLKAFQENNSMARIRKFFLSWFSLLLIVSFFYFGYVLFPEPLLATTYPKNISAGSDYYLVKENDTVYLGGICKYTQFQIQRILKQNFCNDSIKIIYIEEETCLSLANLCKKDAMQAKIITNKKMPDWEKKYSYLEYKSNPNKRKFSKLLVFYPHLDSLSVLQRDASKEYGNILLLFAYKLNDNAKDWNENKNILGINRNWNFITPDEL